MENNSNKMFQENLRMLMPETTRVEMPREQLYEFLPFHPVCVTSEMVGTSIEELLTNNFPSKRSWECSRLGEFPQDLIVRLNYRSHMKYIVLKSKVDRNINEVELFVGDGISGNFTDTEYLKVGYNL